MYDTDVSVPWRKIVSVCSWKVERDIARVKDFIEYMCIAEKLENTDDFERYKNWSISLCYYAIQDYEVLMSLRKFLSLRNKIKLSNSMNMIYDFLQKYDTKKEF